MFPRHVLIFSSSIYGKYESNRVIEDELVNLELRFPKCYLCTDWSISCFGPTKTHCCSL